MSLYDRVLGIPFVYTRIRPLIVGGVDMSPSYRNLDVGPDDVVVDVGCGPGEALKYLSRFRALHGFDTDPRAIAFARKLAAGRPDVSFEARELVADDLTALQPTRVMMNGLLHHLDDTQAVSLLSMCARTPSVRRIATQDVVYLPGKYVSNLLAALDRGQYVREVEGYRALVAQAGLSIAHEEIIRSHPKGGRALYLIMALERPAT
ncbi:MAG TPA: class I SAM-dependent methyltransferase [Polyangia bacterium]|jgi:SAM-dependent methyltransferase|nr:class I SAM-dependent methyltransferase [Polyangia bacterium]